MNISSLFTKSFSSFSSEYLSKTISLQNLLKSGLSPTLKTFNGFLAFLWKTRRFDSVLHFFSQMNSNKITGNSRTRTIVARALLKTNKFEEAERFITQMVKDGFSPQNSIWDSLIQGLCTAGENPEKALSVLQDCLRNHSILLSRFTFYSLVHSFSSQGEMGRSIEVLEVMTGEKFRYPICNFICSSVISGFCKVGKPELALEFYENAEKMGTLHRPNVVTYTALVSALCKEGRIKEVCDLVCRMEKEGVVLDAVFYSSWICGYFREGILQGAFWKHRSMVENGIKPDTVSYTILIDGFSKEGNVEKAMGFLNELRKDELEPNLITYTAILQGFCKRGKLEEAFCVFKRVEELGIRVDEVTYSTLINGLCRKGDFDRVFLLLKEMDKKGISAGIITYNTVINGLCKVGRMTEADEIFNDILGDNFTYSTLLHGYIKENNVIGILETKRRLEEAEVPMDVVMCNVLIKALFMVGALEDAYMIFNGMPEMGLLADSVTYCTMIDGYCRVGWIDEALEIFDVHRKTSSTSSLACYNCIIRGLCGNDMAEMAIDVFLELIEKALIPDTVTYMMLIKSIFQEKNGGVLKFLHQVEKLDPEIFSVMCNDITHFLCKKGCFEAAFDVYTLMRRKGLGITSKCHHAILKGLITNGTLSLIPVMLNAYLKDCGASVSRISRILVLYLCKKNVKEALNFLDRMKEKCLHVAMPVAVLEVLIKQGRILDAHELVMSSEGNQSGLDVVAYSIVVNGLCNEGHLNKALDLCSTMRKKGFAPNIVTYNSVISGLCREGCLVEALRIFDSLEKIGLVPTNITYGALICALSKEGYLQDAKQLFKKMILKGIIPNTHLYNSLIDGYCKFGLLEEALKLLVLEKSCFIPDAFTVTTVIDGFCRKGDMEGGLRFYFECKRKGIIPDFLGFIYLIKGLCVKGRMEEARSVLREMLQIESMTELISSAGSEIETESLVSFLVFLCEQGSIEEATSVLSEVGSIAFPSKRRPSGSTNLKKLNGREALSIVTTKSLTSPYIDNSGMRYCEVGYIDSGSENVDNFVRKPLLNEFDAFYSLVASLCSEGKLEKANAVAKEMLLNAQRGH